MFPIPFRNLFKPFHRKIPINSRDLATIEKIRIQLNKVNTHQPEDAYLKTMGFIVFDTETTGFYPFGGDRILSIGAVRIEKATIQEESFHSYINPNRAIPQNIKELTGIEEAQVEEAPSFLEVFSSFLDFIEKRPLIAHCTDFDLNFINVELKKFCKTKITGLTFDTMNLASLLEKEDHPLTLDHLLSRYGLPKGRRHHALEDAQMTAQLFLHQLDELEKQGVYTLSQLEKFIIYKNDIKQYTQAVFNSL